VFYILQQVPGLSKGTFKESLKQKTHYHSYDRLNDRHSFNTEYKKRPAAHMDGWSFW
jgi:hypothetical protein